MTEIRIDYGEVNDLEWELYQIGKSEGYLGEPSGKFDERGRNTRAREIGERLNEMGGFDLMIEVHNNILDRRRSAQAADTRGSARSLEACWGYIGRWQP